MNFLTLFWEFFKAAVLSFGGLGNLPILVQSLVYDHGWTTEQTFGEALAVARIGPGPNGLHVVALGYLMMGTAGAIAATVATMLPSLLILPLSSVYDRVARHPRIAGAMRMLNFALIGTLLVTAVQLVQSSSRTPVDVAIALIAPAIVLLRPNWNPVFVLAVAAVAGLILYF